VAIGSGGAREPEMAWWPLGCSAALLRGEKRRMEATAEAGERAEGVGRRGGTWGPQTATWRAAPAHGGHGAAKLCRGRRERARADDGERAGVSAS
jgi:hypothetical protein